MSDASRTDSSWVRPASERFGFQDIDGVAHVDGVSLERIAKEVGTPTYVYGADHVTRRYRELDEGLGGKAIICYAVKANSSQAILRHLARLGAGADIVSGGELQRVLHAGIAPNRVVFSGVGKRDDEIDAAIEAGIRSINVESGDELDRISARAQAMGRTARVTLRVNPDVDPQTHPYLATGLREAKFGIPMERAGDLARHAHGLPGLELVGLACHIGSQITEATPFLDSIDRLRGLVEGLAADGIKLRMLDVGGGLGIAYGPDDPVVDAAAWGKAVRAAGEALGLELVVEPGRYLVGNAGVLLTKVMGRKRGEEKGFVIVDAAMNDLLRPALYDAYHAVVPVRDPAQTAQADVVDVVGPVCECGDFIAQGRALERVEPGALLAILGAGAYGMTMASTYNTRPAPAEVFVSEGRYAVTRPRKTVADLIGDEVYPDWLA